MQQPRLKESTLLTDVSTIALLLFFLCLSFFGLMTRYLRKGQQIDKVASGYDGTHFRLNSRCKNSCLRLSQSSLSYPFVSSIPGKLPGRLVCWLRPRIHQYHPASAYRLSPAARYHRTTFVRRLLMSAHGESIALPR